MTIAAQLRPIEQSAKPESRFARRKKGVFEAAPADMFSGCHRVEKVEDIRNLGLSILQFVGSSLDGGPRGVHPPTHVAALGALAGYGAKLSVSIKVARGELTDDFRHVPLSRSRSILASEQVNTLVLKEDCPSVATIVIDSAMRCGLSRLPDTDALLHEHLLDRDIFSGLPGEHRPDVPCETLLMMYWEPVARFFRSGADDLDLAPMAAAHAAGEAISAYRTSMPVDASLQVALRAAIAMSKIDRAF